MKFTIVVVMLALAVGVQSSVLPWPYAAHVPVAHSWAHGPVFAHHGPVWADHHHGAVVAHHAVVAHPAGISLSQGPAWGHHHAAPIAHAVHAPVVHAHAHEGHYVAETRGAVHTAPLAGHVNSVSSVNVAPAPGTW